MQKHADQLKTSSSTKLFPSQSLTANMWSSGFQRKCAKNDNISDTYVQAPGCKAGLAIIWLGARRNLAPNALKVLTRIFVEPIDFPARHMVTRRWDVFDITKVGAERAPMANCGQKITMARSPCDKEAFATLNAQGQHLQASQSPRFFK